MVVHSKKWAHMDPRMGIGPFSILLLKMTKTSVVVHMLCAFGTYPIDKTEKIGDSEKSHLAGAAS